MGIVNLNQKKKIVEVKGFELDNSIVFEFFNNKVAEKDYDAMLTKAIYIGVLGLMEDRFSAFLSKTQNELGTELESLKMIFNMKQEIFQKTAVQKGTEAETDIAKALTEYLKVRGISDEVKQTGDEVGKLSKNKTGDIVCEIKNSNKRIVIESKFNKSFKLGDITQKDVFAKSSDTAWSQLLESTVNRDGQASIIVFDKNLVDSSITKICDNVTYIPSVGFIVIVDTQAAKFDNLFVAYLLARDIAVHSQDIKYDKEILKILISRLVKDMNNILKIRELVCKNIENNEVILKELEKGMLTVEFSEMYFKKFLTEGTLSAEDLLEFYQGENMKMHYQVIEKEIKNMIEAKNSL